MRPYKPALIALAFAAGIVAAMAGFQLQRLVNADQPPAGSAVAPAGVKDGSVIGKRRPDFALPDPDGRQRTPAEWNGKILVVNFWATWCPPCLEEMPVFMALQARYADQGVQFLGVAMDDLDNVRRFVDDMGLNYPTVYGQMPAMELSTAFGNRIGALPYTALVGRDGRILETHVGALDGAEAEALIERALAP